MKDLLDRWDFTEASIEDLVRCEVVPLDQLVALILRGSVGGSVNPYFFDAESISSVPNPSTSKEVFESI